MKTWMKRLAVVLVVVQAGVAWAGESPWTLRLGASYRDFDDVDFESVAFRNWGQSGVPDGPYGVQNATTAPGLMGGAVLDYVRYNGGSEGVDSGDKWAPSIGFRYDLTPACERGTTLALVGNLQYYRLDFGASASGTQAAPGGFSHELHHHPIAYDPSTPLLTPTPWALPGSALLPSPPGPYLGTAIPGTTFSIRNQFEMDLYVLDIGLEARATMDRVNLTVALGPSLTIADAESSQTQQAAWQAQAPANAPPPGFTEIPGVPADSYAEESSDSDTDFLLGAYAALGVNVDLSDSWSVGLECRYDYVDRDAGTDQAELDLSGASGIVRLAYKF